MRRDLKFHLEMDIGKMAIPQASFVKTYAHMIEIEKKAKKCQEETGERPSQNILAHALYGSIDDTTSESLETYCEALDALNKDGDEKESIKKDYVGMR